MYAKGMTTRDIQSHVEEIYGIKLSATSVSNIKDMVINMVKEWQPKALGGDLPRTFPGCHSLQGQVRRPHSE